MNTGSTTGIGSSIISSTSDIGSHTSNDSGHGISSSTNNILAVAVALAAAALAVALALGSGSPSWLLRSS